MTPDSTRSPSPSANSGRTIRLAFAYWLPVALYVTLIFMLSSRPSLRPPLRFQFSDKVLHLLEYAGLGLLVSRALRVSAPGLGPTTRTVIAIVGGMAIGASDEWFQSTVPGRDSSVFDFAADTVGVALAQWLPRGIVPE